MTRCERFKKYFRLKTYLPRSSSSCNSIQSIVASEIYRRSVLTNYCR